MADPELMQSLTQMLADALKSSFAHLAHPSPVQAATAPTTKTPSFSVSEYRSSDTTSVADYFNRFEWALQLSNIPEAQYAHYARVHMGAELNNAVKFLVSPNNPADVPYDELRKTLVDHFDQAKDKYVESIKFREIVQQRGESISSFVLRLKQGAANCEYGEFLDRMLIEQLLHGLESREMCDEIIAKKPVTFKDAFGVAHTLEATRNTTKEVQIARSLLTPEATNKLGYERPKTRRVHPSSSSSSYLQMSHKPNYNEKTSFDQSVCGGCGGNHPRNKCKFQSATCFNCGKTGHISKVCRAPKRNFHDQSTSQVQSEEPAMQVDVVQSLDKIHSIATSGKRVINVIIDGRMLEMEVDTGAPCGIISEAKLRTLKPSFTLLRTDRQFSSYTGHRIQCLGRLPVNVSIGKTTRKLDLYVVSGDYDTLCGREWIAKFSGELDLNELFAQNDAVHSLVPTAPVLLKKQQQALSQLLATYEDVFSETPGKLIGPSASVHLKPGTVPVFAKARDVPLALRSQYAQEIDKKLAAGVYERVDYSEWASPTHIVVKKNGKLRITGNYKPTVNPRMIIDEHPIPKIESIFHRMKGANLFCHLDVTDAYTHLTIDAEFRHILTLNTPTHGLVRPTRAVYGAANIPAIWQRRMEAVLQGLSNVINFFDDVIVFADNFENLLIALTAVFDRMRHHGLRLNRSKCVFGTPVLECLGHKIDINGLHKSDQHIEAIRNAPRPTNADELQLFLGKATYYNAFIPNLSTRSRCLRDMLQEESFVWESERIAAYEDIKTALISPQVLMQYDPDLPLILATDASKTGLGAVLSHRLGSGLERPIAYASCAMSHTEQRYPQIDKEALAIVWAVKKFFNYLYARRFTLVTDNKPLSQILHPTKSLPIMCISRMANYADYLAHFNFDVVFKSTKQNVNADYCSRIPQLLPRCEVNKMFCCEARDIGEDELDVFAIHQVEQLPIRAEHIARETRKDPSLGKIVQLLEAGTDLTRSGYKSPESKYTLAANCLLFEHRVVVPSVLRSTVLNDLHVAHIGMVKMKGIARSFVYWPGIDVDIETTVKSCFVCARQAHAPPKFSEHHWQYPKGAWERIHIDYAGPVAGSMLLIVVDAYSKWLEVKVTTSTTAETTIGIMDELFSRYGAPITVVSDNGPQFTAGEFKLFLQKSGVKFHKLSAPYHPATNGQAERYVQTTKDALKAMGTTASNLQSNLNNFLQQYRLAPHATTGESPAKLFLGRTLRTRLDLLKPDGVHQKVTIKQQANFERTFRQFCVGQSVYFLSGNSRMDKWIRGVIGERIGDLHYEIDYAGKRYKRHIDQIRSRLDVNGRLMDEAPGAKEISQQDTPRATVVFFDDDSTGSRDPSTPVIPKNSRSPQMTL
ncbi:uncharacterized protein K02A2.6-like [Toxorhynchites rutilus septentrionalis]|uniref:uncharacterized protein K02A2.6-like n=1 Tax=Toxorhynchites rutilus septentrionalis TaxID=329112 RepID=UPI00247B115C|nr:uncharacterized protein K02A2.6-like [Toxorhynchites rutilus septentrionalis]